MHLKKIVNKIKKKYAVKNEMEYKGFSARLMRAERLKDTGCAYGLPPGSPIDVFEVDALPGAPKEWVGGSGSYVCPVSQEWGLWFDWTRNDQLNTAILASVKGMNPVTGQKIEKLSMESYEEECPIHKSAFKGERLCEECGYKWPPKNYICSPDILWWDGFRQADGTVRQFFFTEDEARDIASHVIGKENTVPAFGFAFFEPIERRKRALMDYVPTKCLPRTTIKWTSGTSFGSNGIIETQDLASGTSYGMTAPLTRSRAEENDDPLSTYCMHVDASARSLMPDPEKDVSVGAGAEIRQNLSMDSLKVSDWKSEASAIIRLYFVFASEFESIVSNGGIKDLNGHKEGFLQGLPVG